MTQIDLTSDIVASMDAPDPQLSEVAPQAAQTPPPPAEGFNADLHENVNGKPVLNVDGSFRRKRGRKPSSFVRTEDSQRPASEAPQTPPLGQSDINADPASSELPTADEADRAARATVGHIVAFGSMIGGDEWHPRRPEDHPVGLDEEEAMIDAWRRYYLLNGCNDVPWLGVAGVTAQFVAARVAMPKTKSFIQSQLQWLLVKLGIKRA